MATSWPLVGRSEELEFLQRAIADAAVAAVVVAGPAGVGKTRLAHEALAHARHQGLATAWAVATHSAAAIPFGAVAHLLPHPLPPSLGLANLLRALGEAVVGAHPGARLVLGVDDAHLLDHSSAALVHHLAATGGAFVLATVRSGEQTPDAVRALGKDLGQRLELQSLSRAEVEALVPAVLGGDVDRAALRELWQASRGNALFLRELIADGLAAGTVEWVGGLWRWRGQSGRLGALTELVESRLAGLAPAQRQALEVIAAAEPVGLALLEFLVPPPAVEALERAGLVQTTVDQRRVAISVAHPLYAEVVRAATPRSRTQNIAAGLARALEATGTRRRQDVLRLATWSVEASSYDRPQLLLAGAAQASSALDFALAERLARAAGDGGGLAGRLIRAQALAALGQCAEADGIFAEAEAVATDDEQRTQLAIARALNLFFWLDRVAGAEAVIEAAAERVAEQAFRDELEAWRAGLLLYSGRGREGLALAITLLDKDDLPPRAAMWAALVATWGLALAGRFIEFRAIAGRAVEVMSNHVPVLPFASEIMLMRASLPALLEGRLSAALDNIRQCQQDALEHGRDPLVPMCGLTIGLILRVQGKVASALRHQRETTALCREIDWGHHLPDSLAESAHCSALLGDITATEAALVEMDSGPRPLGYSRFGPGMARTWAAAARGELSRAAELARDTAAACAEMGQWVLEAMALYDTARLGEARSVAPRLVELAGMVEGELVAAFADHVSALVARDEMGLLRASQTLEAMGAMLYAAEAAAEAARVAAAAGRRSTALAQAARARALAAHCEGARTPALADLDQPLPLTRREREVATLAARGLSNREIAERLVVSVRTAEGHLNQVFAKLGVTQRHELRPILGPDPSGPV